MKFKEFKYCIIVDENNRPMAWNPADGQLCYVSDEYYEDDVLSEKIFLSSTPYLINASFCKLRF